MMANKGRTSKPGMKYSTMKPQLALYISAILALAIPGPLLAQNTPPPAAQTHSANWYLIEGEPNTTLSGGSFPPSRILALDTAEGNLTSYREITESDALCFIRVYHGAGVALFGFGLGAVQKLIMMPLTNPDSSIAMTWTQGGTAVSANLLLCEDAQPVVSLGLRDQSVPSMQRVFLSTSGKQGTVVATASSPCNQASLRTTGAGALVDYTFADIVRVTIDTVGRVVPIDLATDLNFQPIPESVLDHPWSREWILSANEEDFAALILSEEWVGLDSTRMLVYSKKSRAWKRVNLPGAATIPRTINGWLVGMELKANPQNRPREGFGFPPLPSGDAILYRPTDSFLAVVSLGQNSEVLYVRGQTLVYRVADSLYMASINGGGMSDRSLLVSDTAISHVHWLFTRED